MLEPVLPACAAALAAGTINTGHITIIRGTLKKASAYIDARKHAQLESTLVDIATINTPETLQKAADHALLLLNQDGNSPDLARHRRGLTIGAQDADGLTFVSGWVDAEFAAYLHTILDVWARPGINNPDDPAPQHNPAPNPLDDESAVPESNADSEFNFEAEPEPRVDPEPEPEPEASSEVEPEAEEPEVPDTTDPTVKWNLEDHLRDPRTPSQRNHDAIKAVLRDTLMSKRLGQHNGLPVTVVVSTTLRELEAAAGIAVTGSGTLMPMADLIRLAEHAHHYLIVYREHTAEPLYMGRSKRLATKAQRLLLYNRDRGCTRPGCTQAACRCQAHHADPSWQHGGLTDAPTLGLGCQPDNLLAELGWTTSIDPVTGRCHWHPPPLMDTGQDTLNHHFHPEELLPPEPDEDS